MMFYFFHWCTSGPRNTNAVGKPTSKIGVSVTENVTIRPKYSLCKKTLFPKWQGRKRTRYGSGPAASVVGGWREPATAVNLPGCGGPVINVLVYWIPESHPDRSQQPDRKSIFLRKSMRVQIAQCTTWQSRSLPVRNGPQYRTTLAAGPYIKSF